MYQYNDNDKTLVNERVEQYRDQTQRFLAKKIPDEDFRTLRLMNGLYIQRQAPMLRIAVPYGLMSSAQMRMLAHVARKYDRGYGHFTTRTNLQLNWPKLEDVPDILAELATVEMHAIQTSGNCIRNTTTDPLAGVAPDEIEDPRPWCELIRQWSTLHPEFAYLPRKFKMAVTGSPKDRAASEIHDIGIHLVKNEAGEVGFEILVGGGLGRTPHIGKQICPFLEKKHLLSYLEAILRVYNLSGRRDKKYMARIKILVNKLGIDTFREMVDAEWALIKDSELQLPEAEITRIKNNFKPLDYNADAANDNSHINYLDSDPAFKTWYKKNTCEHKQAGYRVVYLSLKSFTKPAGDISDSQMDAVADLADQYSFGEIRATFNQNLVLAEVEQAKLYSLWKKLAEIDLAKANIGTLTDMIVCPGFEFCALADATTLDVADQINARFDDLDYLYDLGDIHLNFSGCLNACGHHHTGHIGILGVDNKGENYYQFRLGGSANEQATLGAALGKGVAKDKVVDTLENILNVYLENRSEGETFFNTYHRIGIKPFKEKAYAATH